MRLYTWRKFKTTVGSPEQTVCERSAQDQPNTANEIMKRPQNTFFSMVKFHVSPSPLSSVFLPTNNTFNKTDDAVLNSCMRETLEINFVTCELMNLNISEQHVATRHHMTRNCKQLSILPLLGGSCDECGNDGSAVGPPGPSVLR